VPRRGGSKPPSPSPIPRQIEHWRDHRRPTTALLALVSVAYKAIRYVTKNCIDRNRIEHLFLTPTAAENINRQLQNYFGLLIFVVFDVFSVHDDWL
jgi:hypothetical protein